MYLFLILMSFDMYSISTMEEPTLGEQVEVPSSQQAMTMMHQLMSLVSFISIYLSFIHPFLSLFILYSASWAGIVREPKYGHLKELHRAIKMCEPALISSKPSVQSLGNYQQVKNQILLWIYQSSFLLKLMCN